MFSQPAEYVSVPQIDKLEDVDTEKLLFPEGPMSFGGRTRNIWIRYWVYFTHGILFLFTLVFFGLWIRTRTETSNFLPPYCTCWFKRNSFKLMPLSNIMSQLLPMLLLNTIRIWRSSMARSGILLSIVAILPQGLMLHGLMFQSAVRILQFLNASFDN